MSGRREQKKKKKKKKKELPPSVPPSALVSTDRHNHRRLRAKGKGSATPFLLRADADVPYQPVSRRTLDTVIGDVLDRYIKLGTADLADALATYVAVLVDRPEHRTDALYNFFYACYSFHTAAADPAAPDDAADPDDPDAPPHPHASNLATFVANLASCGYKVSDLNIRLEGVGPDAFLVSKGPGAGPAGVVPDVLRTADDRIYNKQLDHNLVATVLKAVFLQKAHVEKASKRDLPLTRFFGMYLAKKFNRDDRLVTEWAYNLIYYASLYRSSEADIAADSPCTLFYDSIFHEAVDAATANLAGAPPSPPPAATPSPDGDSDPATTPRDSDADADAGAAPSPEPLAPSLPPSLRAQAEAAAKNALTIITCEEQERREAEAAAAAAAKAAAEAEPEQEALEVPAHLTKALDDAVRAGDADATLRVLDAMDASLRADARASDGVHDDAEFAAILSAAVNVQDAETGLALLHTAARVGAADVVRVLVDHGARVDAAALNGFTPLHVAAYHGYDDAIAMLLSLDADPNAIDVDGLTALHLAAGKSHLTVAVFLDPTSSWYPMVDINCTTHAGWTPLFMAAHASLAPVVDLLLASGADRSMRSHLGRTALDYGSRFEPIKAMLEVPTSPTAESAA